MRRDVAQRDQTAAGTWLQLEAERRWSEGGFQCVCVYVVSCDSGIRRRQLTLTGSVNLSSRQLQWLCFQYGPAELRCQSDVENIDSFLFIVSFRFFDRAGNLKETLAGSEARL